MVPHFRLRSCAGDQVTQGHSGPRRDRSGQGNGLSFSVPGHWTCRPTRRGIPLGSCPVDLVVSGRHLAGARCLPGRSAWQSPSEATTGTSLFRSRADLLDTRTTFAALTTISRSPTPSQRSSVFSRSPDKGEEKCCQVTYVFSACRKLLCPVLSFSNSLRARYSHSSASLRRLPPPRALIWRRTVARPGLRIPRRRDAWG